MLALNGIARHLRAGRVANGALRLDNTKLFFGMDANGNPISAAPYGKNLHQLPCCTAVCVSVDMFQPFFGMDANNNPISAALRGENLIQLPVCTAVCGTYCGSSLP